MMLGVAIRILWTTATVSRILNLGGEWRDWQTRTTQSSKAMTRLKRLWGREEKKKVMVQDHLILMRVEERKRKRKVRRVRHRVAGTQKREARQPMTLEPWRDWWKDLWKLNPATEAWTRDCGTGWFLSHGVVSVWY